MNRNPRYKAREEQSEDANHDCKCAPERLPRRPAAGIRAFSFDHLVGAGEQCWRYVESKSIRCLEIYDELNFGRVLHRQVGGLLALEDPIDIAGRKQVWIDRIR